jgi:beta-lactamase regulating signal transducer with metallopeptidase domain
MFAIVDFLNPLSAAWAGLMVAAVWQSTVLALVIAVVTWRWKRSTPGIRYWLWQIVAFKLLILPVWTVTVPIPGLFPRSPSDRPSPPPLARMAPPSADRPERRPTSVARTGPEPVPVMVVPPSSSLPDLSIAAWLMMGWMLVVSVLILRAFRQRSRLVGLLGRASPVDDAALKIQVTELAGQIGLRRVPELREAAFQGSPFVCSPFRPLLVLPAGLVGSIEPIELRQILLHELAHLKRGDLFWDWFPAIARMLFFFHPVAHWAAGRILLERELACDQTAMTLSDRGPAHYARMLIRVARLAASPWLEAGRSQDVPGDLGRTEKC